MPINLITWEVTERPNYNLLDNYIPSNRFDITKTTTIDEIATHLNNEDDNMLITYEQEKACKEMGIVVIYANCDDYIHFQWAIQRELHCELDTVIFMYPAWFYKYCDKDEYDHKEDFKKSHVIQSSYDNETLIRTYKTDIPHAKFRNWIVFKLLDVNQELLWLDENSV